MPENVRTPVLHVTRFRKHHFLCLSEPERELFVRIGYALNELRLFRRIYEAFTGRAPKTPLALEANPLQLTATLLVLIGKIHETSLVIEKWFSKKPLCRAYLAEFSPRAAKAYELMKKLNGSDFHLLDTPSMD